MSLAKHTSFTSQTYRLNTSVRSNEAKVNNTGAVDLQDEIGILLVGKGEKEGMFKGRERGGNARV